jgi:hypothetical protein
VELVLEYALPLSRSVRLFLIPVDFNFGMPPENKPPKPIGLPLLILFPTFELDTGLFALDAFVFEDSPLTLPKRKNKEYGLT